MANAVLYGLYNRRDLYDQRVTAANIREINAAVDATTAEHNRQLDALIGLFAQKTTDYSERYVSPAAARLQPLDENGRARPIKRAGYYDVAYPIQHGGTAWGATYETRIKMTGQEVANTLGTMLTADARWVRDHILAALFSNVNWTFTDPDKGALTIKGLANADTDTFTVLGGADVGATDQHYLGQAAAIEDANNPFNDIYDELTEHPENGGEVVVLVPTANLAATELLTDFIDKPDMNVTPGSSTAVLSGSPGVALPGRLVGYTNRCWVVEWKSLPTDYLIGVTTQGEKTLAMRENAEGELQGFNREAERNDHPFYESQYARRCGFGARNRVGAVVFHTGDASYDIPTGYTSPLY